MELQEDILIQAPVETVFAYLNQVDQRTNYIPMLSEVIMLDAPPIKVGSRYIEVATIAGQDLKTTYQVVAWEEDRYIKVKTIKSVFPIQAEMKLNPIDGGTHISLALSFTLKGMYRLAAPLIRGIVQQQANDILDRLKKILEA